MNFIVKCKIPILSFFGIVLIVTVIFCAPFDPNNWGTVSDWMMVIVTSFTALYLVKTFGEQKRANDITIENRKKLIKPKISIKANWDYEAIDFRYYLTLSINDNDASALEIDTAINIIDKNKTIFDYHTPAGSKIKIYLHLSSVVPQDSVIFHITFYDSDGNKYKQTVMTKHDKTFYCHNACEIER